MLKPVQQGLHEDKEVAAWNKLPELPLVSVCVLAYNQSEYVQQALDSILSQKVAFPFEVCIGEDGSTDGTREICLSYAEQYPAHIRLFLRDRKNEQRKRYKVHYVHNAYESLKACRGKYLAFCEGDDYWLDANKLAKQVECLENNPDTNICFHDVEIIDSIGRHPKHLRKFSQKKEWKELISEGVEFGLKDIAKGGLIHTTAALVRNKDMNDYPSFALQSPTMDWELRLFVCGGGRIKYINSVLSAYRIHEKGESNKLITRRDSLYGCRITTLAQFDRYYHYAYHDELRSALLLWWERIDQNRWRILTFFQLLFLSPRNACFYGQYEVGNLLRSCIQCVCVGVSRVCTSVSRFWGVMAYERQEINKLRRAMAPIVQELLQEGAPIVVYGAGKHTVRLLKLYRSKLPFKAIFDDKPRCDSINKIPVMQPSLDILDKHVILVSSDCHEDVLFEKAKKMLSKGNRIIRIYNK